MSTVGIIDEPTIAFSLPKLNVSAAVAPDMNAEEIMWLCLLALSVITFVYTSLKR